jgi:hypothetical protein
MGRFRFQSIMPPNRSITNRRQGRAASTSRLRSQKHRREYAPRKLLFLAVIALLAALVVVGRMVRQLRRSSHAPMHVDLSQRKSGSFAHYRYSVRMSHN